MSVCAYIMFACRHAQHLHVRSNLDARRRLQAARPPSSQRRRTLHPETAVEPNISAVRKLRARGLCAKYCNF